MTKDDDDVRPFRDQGRMTHERFEAAVKRYESSGPRIRPRPEEPVTPPRAPRTEGTVVILECPCGNRAGFRIVGDFATVRTRVMARKAGWTNDRDVPPRCPTCTSEGAVP